jgi:hypothetical protein
MVKVGGLRMKIQKTKNISVSIYTHRDLKIISSYLNMPMCELLAVVASKMLPLVQQGVNPLSEKGGKQ